MNRHNGLEWPATNRPYRPGAVLIVLTEAAGIQYTCRFRCSPLILTRRKSMSIEPFEPNTQTVTFRHWFAVYNVDILIGL